VVERPKLKLIKSPEKKKFVICSGCGNPIYSNKRAYVVIDVNAQIYYFHNFAEKVCRFPNEKSHLVRI